jgi:predicted lactoylglutathione lyase
LAAEEQREERRRRNEVLCDIRAQNSQEMRKLVEKYSKEGGRND